MTDRNDSWPASPPPPVLTIDIHPPRIAGDAVTFGWNQSLPNPFQRRNTWSVVYPGLDLSAFAPELLLEVFLALQIKVWGRHDGAVRLRLPVAMPSSTIAFWRDYHRVADLDATPLADDRPREPWPGGASGLHRQHDHVVFFGGGKDSGAAAGLLHEIGGPGSTLLLSHTASLDPRPGIQEAARRRIVDTIHRPVAAATGMPTATFWSDYLSNWRRDSDPPRPFLEFFHAGALPLLVAHGARLTSVGHPRNDFFVLSTADTPLSAIRWSGRPETLAALAAQYHRAWGLDLQPTSAVYPMSVTAQYILLAERYPGLYQTMVSCASTSHTWCYACRKCLRHALATLSTGVPHRGFDYGKMFRSRFTTVLIAAIRAHDRERLGYLAHTHFASGTRTLPERMSQLAATPLEALDRMLDPDARAVWDTLRAHYDGPLHPESTQIPRAGIAGLPPTLRGPLTSILDQHFAIVDDIPDVPYPDGSTVMYPWHVPLTLVGEVERLVPEWARPTPAPGAV